jgi:hypothetical protein
MFESLFRWAFSLVGLGWILSFRDPVCVVMIGRVMLRFVTSKYKVNPNGILLWIFFSAIFLYSVIVSHSLLRTIYGTKALLGFIFGVTYSGCIVKHINAWRKIYFFIGIIVIVGLLWEKIFDLPWKGQSFSVGILGVEKSLGKDAQAYMVDVPRLHGFSSSANPAAVYAALAYILYSCSYKRWNAISFLLLIITYIAVVLTTIKSVLLALLIVNCCNIFRPIPWLWEKMVCFSTTIFVTLAIGMPALLSFGASRFPHFVLDMLDTHLASFSVRIIDTWPLVFLNHKSSFLGSGLGAVGGVQSLFDPWGYMRGGYCDNWFVFVFLTGGVFSVILMACALVQASRVKCSENRLIPTAALFISIYGTMEACLELPALNMLIGVLLGYVYMRDSPLSVTSVANEDAAPHLRTKAL